jgi:hypothetical protein
LREKANPNYLIGKVDRGLLTVEKTDKPSPTSYNTQTSFFFATKPRGNMVIGKSKRTSVIEETNKLKVSPGPSIHNPNIRAVEMLSRSPSFSRKRL